MCCSTAIWRKLLGKLVTRFSAVVLNLRYFSTWGNDRFLGGKLLLHKLVVNNFLTTNLLHKLVVNKLIVNKLVVNKLVITFKIL